MSQAEAVSDSDSNSSTSWTFVDKGSFDNQTEGNQYYLNCDSEPIQELTSPSHPNNSELETDSDGISIISETDDIRENSLSEEPQIEDVGDVLVQREIAEVRAEIGRNKDIILNKNIIIGCIVVAVMTPLLLNYFITYIEQVDHPVNLVMDDLKSEIIPEGIEAKVTPQDLSSTNIPSKTSMERKRKYDSKGEADEHRLNAKENFGLLADRNTVAKKETKKAKPKSELVVDRSTEKINKKAKPKGNKPNSDVPYTKLKSDQKDRDKQIRNKQEDQKRKNKNDKTEALKRQKKKKVKKSKTVEALDADKEIKKLRKLLEKKDKTIKELTKLVKAKDKQLKMFEYKILKQLNSLRKDEWKDYDRKSILQKFNGTSADWYYKMHKGRADFRNKRRSMRDNWYWNWMNDREQLRMKRGFWSFTY